MLKLSDLLFTGACATLLLAPGVVLPQAALRAVEIGRFEAPEARQGAVADAGYIYVISNSTVAKYDKVRHRRVAVWNGSPEQVAHINACTRVDRELVCANSNYPQVPQTSSVEILDAVTMRHVRSIALGPGIGSLTWVDRRNDAWWPGFANYNGRGGEPGRDHRYTTVVRFDEQWRQTQAWLLPHTVLERIRLPLKRCWRASPGC